MVQCSTCQTCSAEGTTLCTCGKVLLAGKLSELNQHKTRHRMAESGEVAQQKKKRTGRCQESKDRKHFPTRCILVINAKNLMTLKTPSQFDNIPTFTAQRKLEIATPITLTTCNAKQASDTRN